MTDPLPRLRSLPADGADEAEVERGDLLAAAGAAGPRLAASASKARAALTEAQQRLDDWRRTGAQSRRDVIAAWKLAAANALEVAKSGQDPQLAIDRVQAVRRWLLAQGYWSEDDDLPAEVEVALRKALRTART